MTTYEVSSTKTNRFNTLLVKYFTFLDEYKKTGRFPVNPLYKDCCFHDVYKGDFKSFKESCSLVWQGKYSIMSRKDDFLSLCEGTRFVLHYNVKESKFIFNLRTEGAPRNQNLVLHYLAWKGFKFTEGEPINFLNTYKITLAY